jgi:hypothetical protein
LSANAGGVTDYVMEGSLDSELILVGCVVDTRAAFPDGWANGEGRANSVSTSEARGLGMFGCGVTIPIPESLSAEMSRGAVHANNALDGPRVW